MSAHIAYEGIINVEYYYPKATTESPALIVEPDRTQRILRAKIFAEFIALLEAFGFLCIAIRNRQKTSMLWSYLNTEPQEVTQFYNQIRSSTNLASLTRLLKLPTPSQIKKAQTTPLSGAIEEILNFDQDYRDLRRNICTIAELYCDNKGANVRIYNKMKHGFSIIEGGDWVTPPITPDEIAILITEGGEVARLPMTQERVELELQNIQRVTLIGAELLALCIALDEISLLFQ